MYCDKVITGVRIFDPVANPNDDENLIFLVLEGSAEEAAAFLGELRASVQSMQNLVEWLQPEFWGHYVLLVSPDGRRGVVFPKVSVDKPELPEQVHYLGTKDDYYPTELKRMVRDFKIYMSFNQELAAHIGFVQGLNPEKKRVRFTGVGAHIRSGDIDHDIQQAIRNLEGATDDALVWLAITGPNNQNGMHPYSYSGVMSEIALRRSKGMEFRSTFFPLNRVSIEEIEQRQVRAELLLRIFNQKCQAEYGGIDFEKAIAWIRALDTDMLGELSVHTYYSDAGRMGEWKYFVPEFQGRMKKSIIY
jgi:hypothetical protein